MRAELDAEPLANVEYVSVADAQTLRELDHVDADGALCSLAVRFGATRLIDNMLLEGSRL
jgi:pantoate--beta-alanine ligase